MSCSRHLDVKLHLNVSSLELSRYIHNRSSCLEFKETILYIFSGNKISSTKKTRGDYAILPELPEIEKIQIVSPARARKLMQSPGLLLLWYWIMHLILRGKRWYIQSARKEDDEIGISRDERKKESLLICQLFVSLDPLMSNFFLICPLDRSRSWSSGGHHWKIFWWPWNQILFSFLLSLLQFLLKTPFLWNRPI